ncbi:MAG TPA: AarF/ABC1/UbiB kinase family protein, partial [Microlunatus sp.]|nr:AarF/ABC1/UbiB kinase family protein [Microlunatus sp.]
GLHAEGFAPADIDPDDLLDYLSPFVEPATVPEFEFSREWLRSQTQRVKDPNSSNGVATRLNLPASYVLIHRVWLGGMAVLSQLNARAPFASVLEEFLPGYAEPSPS